MINKIKGLFNTEDKKRLLSNFLSLSILQGANYILPLITLPYLVRVLGPEKFGLIMFAQAFIQYFVILTDYGFNLSATREISIHRENKEKISEIFSSVMIIKFSLLVISFIILTLIVFSFEKFRKDWLVYYLTFGMVVGQVLFPIWFFQGIEKMKYITFLNILAKTIFTVAIFIFVHQVSDYIYVPLLNSLGFIIAGILALWIVFKDFGINFSKVPFESLINKLKEGWHVFISTIGINLYRNANVFILGIVTNEKVVGYYAIAEKILKAIQSLQNPLGQALFPFFSKKFKSLSNKQSVEIIIKFSKLAFSVYFIISIFIFLFAEPIIKIITGSYLYNSILDLKVLSFIIVIGGMNYFFGVLGLLTLGKNKLFMKGVFLGGMLNIPISLILSITFKDLGASFSLLLSELIILVLFVRFTYLLRKESLER
ncbi:flippase [Persephonella sp. KM09-Lau-8]|uniref:flippase n=1 Tax=Persephonella sp. KM09-Lau-8 TaxID=1158345 RepID=UPI000496E0AB|nr:flippase [Persephonella sp. KM09-Lau-8]